MPFASGDRHIIETFAADAGLPARPARDGSFSFVIDGAATLTFTPAQPDGVALSLSWKPSRLDGPTLRRALGIAGYAPDLGAVVQAGAGANEDLILAVRFAENGLSPSAIDACIRDLFARRGEIDRELS